MKYSLNNEKIIEQMLSLMERIDPQYRQYKSLINEGDSRLKAVDRIINQVFSRYFTLSDTVNNSDYYVNGNPNTTWREYLVYNLRHTFGLMQNSDVKYLPVVARLAYSDEVKFDITNDNGEQINALRRIVNLFKNDNDLFNEVKNNPSITFGELAERFQETFAQEGAADAEMANKIQGGQSEYVIKEVPDFETANYYGNRSCSQSKLCYTQSEETWDQYTSGGMNRVYVCLRNGWDKIPEKPGEGNPYDLYGTSMIFVFISPKGDIVYSNCRWNHHTQGHYNGDVDHAFTKTTLSQTINMPFDSVFKPGEFNLNKLKELIEKGFSDLSGIAVGDFVIPDGVTSIGDYAFYMCEGLTSITIPNSVTRIGDAAFGECTGLTSITIPNSVTSIGVDAFYMCEGLTSITIPNSVTNIGNGAFYKCVGLTSITIPNGVTSIDDCAFYKCVGLTSITIPNSVTSIGGCAFYNGVSLTSITIPDSVTSIGQKAFYWCKGLTSITIPNSVTSIGNDAFSYCKSLTSIDIPNSVTRIGGGTFESCIELTSVTIPNSVTSIGNDAFYGCKGLTRIDIPNSVTRIGGDAFYGCDKLTVYVESEETANIVRESGFNGNIQYGRS